MIMPEKADINLPVELKYLLETQVEEADLVVLNKIDTLSDADLARYMGFLEEACEVPVLAISAREGTGIPQLAQHLISHGSSLREVEIDYAGPDYSQAESVLTWYNRRLYLKTRDGSAVDMNEIVEELVENIRMGLIEKKANAPHLKVYGLAGDDFVKGSLIGVDYDIEYERKLECEHENLRVILNARVTCPARPFSRLADDALDDLCDSHGLDCQVFFTECFGMSDEGRR